MQLLATEQDFGDHAIGAALQMTVERAKHIRQARIAGARLGNLVAFEVSQEAQRRFCPAGRQTVEWDHRSERLCSCGGVAEPELVLVATVSEQQVLAVRCLLPRAQRRPGRWVDIEAVEACRARGENHNAWPVLSKPENVGFRRAQRRINREIVTPSAAAVRRRRHPKQLENPGVA